jgi:hypothetical protein
MYLTQYFIIRWRVSKEATNGRKTALMEVIGFLCVSLGSSTIQLHNSLGSRGAYECSEPDFSSQNGDRAWRVFYRRTEICCAFFFCGKKHSMEGIFINKFFLFRVGSVCGLKRFTTGSRNSLKDVRKSQMMPDQVRKRLRQQSNYFYAAGFEALVKQWDKCINVGFMYVCDLFTDFPSYYRMKNCCSQKHNFVYYLQFKDNFATHVSHFD